MTPRARQRRTRRRIRNAASLLSLVAFLALLGSVGAVEQDLVPLLPGAIRMFGFLLIWPAFWPSPEPSTPPKEGGNGEDEVHGDPVAVQVGQAVKALVLLGEKKITIEETEKDRFVVTTTTETAHSKKVK